MSQTQWLMSVNKVGKVKPLFGYDERVNNQRYKRMFIHFGFLILSLSSSLKMVALHLHYKKVLTPEKVDKLNLEWNGLSSITEFFG